MGYTYVSGPLQAQNTEPEIPQSQSPTTETKGKVDIEETAKMPPPTKATVNYNSNKRPSKQLPRLFIATKRLLTSTMMMAKEPEELFPLPTTSTFFTSDTIVGSTRALNDVKSPGLCSSLPDDLICKVTSFLDVKSLLQIRTCNHYLKELASRNEAGWKGFCRNLWSDKVHVLPGMLFPPPTTTSKGISSELYYMDAYQRSIRDARQRQHVTMEEMCYDPDTGIGTVWSFRFKESAGADWTSTDPWYDGLSSRKMVFLKDGSVRQYVPSAAESESLVDTSNNESEETPSSSSTPIFRRSSSSTAEFSDSDSLPELISPNLRNLVLDTQDPQQQQKPPQSANAHHNSLSQQQRQHNGHLELPPISMSWRLVKSPMDLPTRPEGSYLRFSVGGREVPTYSVRRSPTGNWGFVMESCWGLYTSFELPPKRSSQQQQQQRRRLRRTEAGARWVEIMDNGEEALSCDQHHTDGNGQNDSELMADAALEITNEVQWREAFLYNVGARTLPEGDGATEEFDRAFRGIH